MNDVVAILLDLPAILGRAGAEDVRLAIEMPHRELAPVGGWSVSEPTGEVRLTLSLRART